MKEEEFLKDALEAEKEVEHEEHHKDHIALQEKRKKIIVGILALLLLLMFLAWYLPSDFVKLDPEPKNIPKLSEFHFDIQQKNITHTEIKDIEEYNLLISPEDPLIKDLADSIVTQSCASNERACFAKALFYFVRDNFEYVNDPLAFEYVKSAPESLMTQGGDCDDASVLLANLMRSIGINTRFVFIPGHVYVQVQIPEATRKYKDENDWINVDATCKNCAFGEIPFQNVKVEKQYV